MEAISIAEAASQTPPSVSKVILDSSLSKKRRNRSLRYAKGLGYGGAGERQLAFI